MVYAVLDFNQKKQLRGEENNNNSQRDVVVYYVYYVTNVRVLKPAWLGLFLH